jgi:hypothetical protein
VYSRPRFERKQFLVQVFWIVPDVNVADSPLYETAIVEKYDQGTGKPKRSCEPVRIF